jgi:uncharacterized protein (DUF58 family)
MEVIDLIKKVKKIEIKAKQKVEDLFSGAYHSAFKGKGMSFSETRLYQYGDDVRNIDWNVTARTKEVAIKVFEEERHLTIMLMIDLSSSNQFGANIEKSELIAEISAVLAFNALKNNDDVGAILFNDGIVKFIPPSSGRNNVLNIIRELINYDQQKSKTNIAGALKFLSQVVKKKCVCFILSDFIDDNYLDAIKIVSRKHELIPIRIIDGLERQFPNVGIIKLKNNETGDVVMVDTNDPKSIKVLNQLFLTNDEVFQSALKISSIKPIVIDDKTDYIKSFIKYFIAK